MSRKNADSHRASIASKIRTYEDRQVDLACGAGVRRRSAAELDDAILALLTAGPLMKWQIREVLHEPEEYIWRRLKVLKLAGSVRTVGKVLDKRAWALAAWQPTPTPETETRWVKDFVKPKPQAPSGSWWLVSAEEFAAKAKAEAKRMLEAPAR